MATKGGASSKLKASHTVGSLFAAIGGFCRAFQDVGATVLWANEKDKFATKTFVENFPQVRHFHKPIEQLSVGGDALQPVDILTAGFPCQPFSCAGERRGFADERGMLFLHIIRLIREFGASRPKILLLENVQNFRTHDKGKTFKRVQAEIQKAGYWFSEANAQILNTATHTRIPQNRARIFMVAVNVDHFSRNAFRFPDALPQGSVGKVQDFLDLNQPQERRHYFTEASRYYEPFRIAISNGRQDAIYQLRRNYVRENQSGVCFTLMANMGEGGHNKPVIRDPWGIRNLTPRECARLQGYDDSWFKIPTDLSLAQIYKQIGNSVTVPLVTELARRCLELLNGIETSQTCPKKVVRKRQVAK
jgi:DNA (cytosine-5)-methyltransferase 1